MDKASNSAAFTWEIYNWNHQNIHGRILSYMRKLDLYWRKNKDWWKFENGIIVIKDIAPQDAQESYNRYLLQTGLDCLYELSRYQDKLLRLDNGLNTPDILYLCRYFETVKSEISNASSTLHGVHIFRTRLKYPRIVFLMRKYNL